MTATLRFTDHKGHTWCAKDWAHAVRVAHAWYSTGDWTPETIADRIEFYRTDSDFADNRAELLADCQADLAAGYTVYGRGGSRYANWEALLWSEFEELQDDTAEPCNEHAPDNRDSGNHIIH